MSEQYDSRIVMAPGYRPVRPPIRRRRWPRKLGKLLAYLGGIVLVLVGVELWLAHEAIIPRIDRVADYRPKAITRLLAPTGEVVGEVAPARRRLLAPDQMPPAVARAVVARWEPAYLERPSLGQRELVRAIMQRLEGHRDTQPLTVQLVRSLGGTIDKGDEGIVRFAQEWLAALSLERRLPRAELLHLYLNEVPFGRDAFGAAEGARAWFGKPLHALDDKQLTTLVERAGNSEDGGAPARAKIEAVGCGSAAVRKLAERYDADELAHLGADVQTPCEPALTHAVSAAIAHAKLDRDGLVAAAAVMRLPGQEVVALVGDVDAPRPIASLRAPFVLAAALASLKYTMISKVEPDGPTLRILAARSLLEASDGLINAGVSKSGAADVATRAGIASPLEPDAFVHGEAAVTTFEAMSALAVIAEGGLHRLPQLFRSIGGVAESDGARAAVAVVSPEVAYLVATAMQTTKTIAPIKRGRAAWAWLATPDGVVVVSVGTPDGSPLPDNDSADKGAGVIAREIASAAFRSKTPKVFVRPRGLVSRRVDPNGQLLPVGAAAGTEEQFVPGSLPRYEPLPDDAR